MGTILSELGTRLAERWLTLLVLPGALFVGVVITAATLGHAHAFDLERLTHRAETVAGHLDDQPSAIWLILIAALLAAAAAGITARATAAVIEHLWMPPSQIGFVNRWATGRRIRRWQAVQQAYVAARHANAATAALAAARNRISLHEPRRPTWMGDRAAAPEIRIRAQYDLDLASAWPRLWAIMPEDLRGELRNARQYLDTATGLAAWGVLYTAVGLQWWPAAAAGLVTHLVGWRRARIAVAQLADLVEAAVDVHGRDLAAALGIALPDGYITPHLGREISDRLRKGT